MNVSAPASPPDCRIVVIALAGGGALDACLARLAPWHQQCHVVLGEGMGSAASWQPRYPHAQFSEGAGLTVPQRRQRGVDAAQAPLVALLEDTSLPDPGWIEAISDAFASATVAAASGPVRIDPALGARAQALACTEYGRSFPERLTRAAGNNLAYRRSHLLEVLHDSKHGLLESEVHAALAARGLEIALRPRMSVTYAAPDPRGIRVGTRFHHGRLYAAARSARWGMPARLAWATGTLLLPALLSLRSLAAMASAVRPGAWLPTAFWICVMETAWAAGEGTGYLAGGGASLREWR